MKQQTIICDKCKKVIDTKYDNYPNEVILKNGSYVLDLCPSCYSKLLKIIVLGWKRRRVKNDAEYGYQVA